MAINKKDDVISRTSYVRRLDDTGGLGETMRSHSAIQHLWVKDAPGTDIGVLEDIALSCDTPGEVGNPDIDTLNLQIKQVQVVGRGCDANGGKAHVVVYWGRRDQLFGGGKGIKSAWVESFTVKRKKYLTTSGTQTDWFSYSNAAQGDNGPIFEEIDVPAAYLYDLTIQTNTPIVWPDGVGEFKTLTGVPQTVLKHFPDIIQYKSGASSAVYVINKYEWRDESYAWNGNSVSGWQDEAIGPERTIQTINIKPVA